MLTNITLGCEEVKAVHYRREDRERCVVYIYFFVLKECLHWDKGCFHEWYLVIQGGASSRTYRDWIYYFFRGGNFLQFARFQLFSGWDFSRKNSKSAEETIGTFIFLFTPLFFFGCCCCRKLWSIASQLKKKKNQPVGKGCPGDHRTRLKIFSFLGLVNSHLCLYLFVFPVYV